MDDCKCQNRGKNVVIMTTAGQTRTTGMYTPHFLGLNLSSVYILFFPIPPCLPAADSYICYATCLVSLFLFLLFFLSSFLQPSFHSGELLSKYNFLCLHADFPASAQVLHSLAVLHCTYNAFIASSVSQLMSQGITFALCTTVYHLKPRSCRAITC